MPRHKLTAFELKLRETISANLKKVSGGISQQQLSDMTGIPASTISGYFAKRSTPNPGAIQKIADALKVNKSDIDPRFTTSIFEEPADILPIYNRLHPTRQQNVYTYAEKQLNEQQNENVVPFPEQKTVVTNLHTAAGMPIDGETASADAITTVVNVDDIPHGADAVVTVDGDSMEPTFPQGSQIYVHWNPVYADGDLVIVDVLDEGVTFKQISRDYQHKKVILHSLNDRYPDRAFNEDEIKVVGVVIN